ncbi:MAG: flavodoxin family protein [Dehalococcoidales bacterium]|nr:flavodoxin family protein [Dehalococcoidales bacterium]
MIKILCVGGSPREGGNSDKLVEWFLKNLLGSSIMAEGILLRNYKFQSCVGCEKCRKDKSCTGLQDEMQLIYPKILECRGLILISPVHNYNITAKMKSFIDRLYCFYNFDNRRPGGWTSQLGYQGRKAVISAIGEQPNCVDSGVDLALQAMRLPIEALGYEVVGEIPITGIFEKGEIINYPDILNQAELLGKKLVYLLTKS